MNLHFKNAGRLFLKALLPDRTVAGFTSAALDGTGRESALQGALRGMKEDVFEAAKAPGKIAAEVRAGIQGK